MFQILSLIHSFIIIIISIGLMRIVLDRRISVVTENSYARVSASLGSIIQDKYFRIPSNDIFENFSRIEYLPSEHITVKLNSADLSLEIILNFFSVVFSFHIVILGFF